ncbi:MAG: DNA-directed RNA polymerase subunit omega [Candidatus Omnitrophota bacterium]|nr:MAG: DNA-directed RNA polymerase subunit omega [Candidatus Omnitrophota bacterium]
MEKLLKNTQGSMYKLVILASRRALELGAGSGKLVDEVSPNTKLTSIALREIKENKISFKLKKK